LAERKEQKLKAEILKSGNAEDAKRLALHKDQRLTFPGVGRGCDNLWNERQKVR
jgi:hypothetical protein